MNRNNKRIVLVTGGSGFIGSNFIRYFYNTYPLYHFVNLDLLTYAGNLENLFEITQKESKLPEKDRRYKFIHGDICDSKFLDRIFSEHKFDLVINFAAETHVDRSIINMGDFIRTNIGGVRSLIEAVRNHHVRRFVHISTDEIYGSVEKGCSGEGAPFRPSNPYSASKAAADLIVQAFIRTHRIPALIIRGSNNFGPYQYPEKLIPLAITNIIQNKKIPIHGTGQHIRKWLHVEDFCRAIELIVHKAPDYEIYNVAGEEKTNLEIIDLLGDCFKVDINQYKDHVSDRPGADLRYSPDATKIKKSLGWNPIHTVESSMMDVVKWYLDNRVWWQKIKTQAEYIEHYERQSKGWWQ